MNSYISNHLSDLINKINELDSLSYNDITDKYRPRIECSQKIGSHGWTVSRKTPNNQMEWLNIIETQGEEVISDSFSDRDIDNLFSDLIDTYTERPELFYIERGIDNFKRGHYSDSAMNFLPVIDYNICKITPEIYKKKSGQCEAGLKDVGKTSFDRLTGKVDNKVFLLCDCLPSFSAFSKRLFIDSEEHSFDKGTEPEYLNRNWLMHGRMTRIVKRYECIQLLNALDTFSFIKQLMCEEDLNNEH